MQGMVCVRSINDGLKLGPCTGRMPSLPPSTGGNTNGNNNFCVPTCQPFSGDTVNDGTFRGQCKEFLAVCEA